MYLHQRLHRIQVLPQMMEEVRVIPYVFMQCMQK